MTRDFKREFRHLYDRVDRLHLALAESLAQIQNQEPTETPVRERLAAHNRDLRKILQDHVEAFIESFGSYALRPRADTQWKLN